MSSYWEDALSDRNLNLRKRNYRYMDQKCAPDVVHSVAQMINNLDPGEKSFTRFDLQSSKFCETELTFRFEKPTPDSASQRNEIDKFIGQPLKTLAFAGILEEDLSARINSYRVASSDEVQLLAASDSSCLEFLIAFNEEVVKQSGLTHMFERYVRSDHSKASYDELRDEFFRFFRSNTNLGNRGSSGETEFRRIFPKILNPLTVKWNVPGAIGGRPSKDLLTYSDLRYNRVNFRDLKKKRSESRTEFALRQDRVKTFSKTSTRLAMNKVREYHQGISEVRDSLSSGAATQVHHIFSQSAFPELTDVRENLITLTPSQHMTKAHPMNRTHVSDPEYQLVCLLAKFDSVEASMALGDGFYGLGSIKLLVNEALGIVIPQDLNCSQSKIFVRAELRNRSA